MTDRDVNDVTTLTVSRTVTGWTSCLHYTIIVYTGVIVGTSLKPHT